MITVNKEKTVITHVDSQGNTRIISDVTCLIRDHTLNPDAHPENSVGAPYPGFYQPKPFPSGEWLVDRIEASDHPYTAPIFIRTNAHQTVICFDGAVVEDYGYAMHFSVSPTTLGCLRLASESDARWLGSLVKLGEQVIVE